MEKRSVLGDESLVKVEPVEVQSLSDLADGVYAIRLSEGRSAACGLGSGELIGFNNRTCSVSLSLSPRTTAGPVMRQVGKSELWREWLVRVVEHEDEQKKVTMQAFVDPALGKKAKCLGYMSAFYGDPSYPDACSTPPYGCALFLNGTVSSDDLASGTHVWTVRAGRAEGDFEVHASEKPENYARLLSLEGCENRPTLTVKGSTEPQTYTSWKIIKQYDLVSTASPPPPAVAPPSPPVPSSVSFISGPVISGPSATTSGYVDVAVKDVGGGNGCSVSSIVFTSLGGAVGSVPARVNVSVSALSQGVQVPVKANGYNAIYAVGMCTTGGTTERSNGLSVYYGAPGVPAAEYPLMFTMVILDGSYNPSVPFSQADKNQLCSNLNALVPGGQCTLEYSFLVPAQFRRRALLAIPTYTVAITGTLVYSSNAAAVESQAILSNITEAQAIELVSGLQGTPEIGFPDGVILGPLPPRPVVTSSVPTVDSWQASWTGDERYSFYALSCETDQNVFLGDQNNTTPTLTGVEPDLSPGTKYYCYVAGVIEDDTYGEVAVPSTATEIYTKDP